MCYVYIRQKSYRKIIMIGEEVRDFVNKTIEDALKLQEEEKD
jgi:hypothetical protein